MAILGFSSFMGVPRLRAHPNNHGPLVKVYLLVLFHYFGVCALGSHVVISAPIPCPSCCMTIITTPRIYTWVRCTHTRPLETLLSFVLCRLLINSSSFPQTTHVLLPIDRIVVSYLLLLYDLGLHCNLCLGGGLLDSTWILRALHLFLCLHPQFGRPYFSYHHSLLLLVGCSLFGTDHSGCYSK
jgi:hypothetical protein